jgi:hypothetical protein
MLVSFPCSCTRSDTLWLQTTEDKAAESYAALERKAALYEKLRTCVAQRWQVHARSGTNVDAATGRGEVDDEEETYEVDFLRKGFLADEAAELQTDGQGAGFSAPDTSFMAVRGTGATVGHGILAPHLAVASLQPHLAVASLQPHLAEASLQPVFDRSSNQCSKIGIMA